MHFETVEPFDVETPELGIENLKRVAFGTLETFDIVGDILADKKINFSDAVHAMRLQDVYLSFMASPEALKEAQDLTEAETAELKSAIEAKSKELASDKEPDVLENIAKNAFAVAIAVANLLNDLKKD
ncbi:MAG TPA: hypothetical protein ENH87_03390 [Pricia antarctica]|uniref:Uncharacterized protein n=1 Tax=Pricia antarctica TaxID=641691 RepID=A0A831QNL0_9FLAO|nr:hypothetical protein [Pricia antarctica]